MFTHNVVDILMVDSMRMKVKQKIFTFKLTLVMKNEKTTKFALRALVPSKHTLK